MECQSATAEDWVNTCHSWGAAGELKTRIATGRPNLFLSCQRSPRMVCEERQGGWSRFCNTKLVLLFTSFLAIPLAR